MWFTKEAQAAWHAPATGERGGQPIYSAIAIETGLTLRALFHLPPRQTEGLPRSIADIFAIYIATPDHTNLSRQGDSLTILPEPSAAMSHCILLSTAPASRFMARRSLGQQHGIRWRKLHLGVNAATQEIVTAELTPGHVAYVSEIPNLLDSKDADVASMTADRVYDDEAVCAGVAECYSEAAVIIPPRATAVAGETTATQRDRYLAVIAQYVRMGGRCRSGYNRWSLVETAIFRHNVIFGLRLHARTLPNQRTAGQSGETAPG